MDHRYLILYPISGIIFITLLDALGAIASRKLHFKYARLVFASLALYILAGFIVTKQFGLAAALFNNGLMGFYDGTIGFWLCIKLNAAGTDDEKVRNFLGTKSAIYMICVGIFFGLIGSGLLQLIS